MKAYIIFILLLHSQPARPETINLPRGAGSKVSVDVLLAGVVKTSPCEIESLIRREI